MTTLSTERKNVDVEEFCTYVIRSATLSVISPDSNEDSVVGMVSVAVQRIPRTFHHREIGVQVV